MPWQAAVFVAAIVGIPIAVAWIVGVSKSGSRRADRSVERSHVDDRS